RRFAACAGRCAARPAGPAQPQVPARRAHGGLQALSRALATRLHHVRVRHARRHQRRRRARPRTAGAGRRRAVQVQPDPVQPVSRIGTAPLEQGTDTIVRWHPGGCGHRDHGAPHARRRHRRGLRPARRRGPRPDPARRALVPNPADCGAALMVPNSPGNMFPMLPLALVAALLVGLAGCASTGGSAPGGSMVDGQSVVPRAEVDTEERRRARIRLELASGYYQQRNYSVALDELRQALTIDPDYGAAYGMLGLVYMELKEN